MIGVARPPPAERPNQRSSRAAVTCTAVASSSSAASTLKPGGLAHRHQVGHIPVDQRIGGIGVDRLFGLDQALDEIGSQRT